MKILSCKKTATILLIVTVVSVLFYAYMLARPISYGMKYRNVTEYEGGVFEGTMIFNPDRTMLNLNTNFDEPIESFYYFKNGYVFYTIAKTEEEYKKEVEAIDQDFDVSVEMPFYADEINAFRLTASENDGYSTVYTCTSAIVFAAAFGAVELLLIGLTCASVLAYNKKGKESETE